MFFVVVSLFCGTILCAISGLAIILLWKRKSWLFYLNCVMSVCVLCLFLIVPWVGLQSVIVVLPGHTRLHFYKRKTHHSNVVSIK